MIYSAGTSRFIEHQPCPKCGSRDNLGLYSDHEYCFGCGYYHSHTTYETLKQHLIASGDAVLWDNKKNNEQRNAVFLPDSFDVSIPVSGMKWLEKYDLTIRDIRRFGIGWAQDGWFVKGEQVAPLLIFPIYDKGNLLMWNGRYMGDDAQKPKYVKWGNTPDFLPIFGERGIIVLCEDMVSAIKLSNVGRSCCLFGSTVSLQTMLNLSRITDELILWLDWDKYQHSEKQAQRARQFFKRVRCIHTVPDPKAMSYGDIARLVNEG